MTTPCSGPISLQDVATEFGGATPHAMSEYRGEGDAPASGPISMSDFYCATAFPTVKRVQRGTVYMHDLSPLTNGSGIDSRYTDITVTAVDPSKTWVLVDCENPNGTMNDANYSANFFGRLINSTTLRIHTDHTSFVLYTARICWQLIEFNEGVTSYNYTVSDALMTTVNDDSVDDVYVNKAITAVDLNKSFSWMCGGGNRTADNTIRDNLRLASGSQARLFTNSNLVSPRTSAGFHVLQFDTGIQSVQRVTDGANSATNGGFAGGSGIDQVYKDYTISAVDTSRSIILINSFMANNAQMNARFINSTTVRVSHWFPITAYALEFQVVQFEAGFAQVQHVTVNGKAVSNDGAGSDPWYRYTSFPISSVNTAKSVAIGKMAISGGRTRGQFQLYSATEIRAAYQTTDPTYGTASVIEFLT